MRLFLLCCLSLILQSATAEAAYNWKKIADKVPAGAMLAAPGSMAYDAKNAEFVIFGHPQSRVAGLPIAADTWTFNRTTNTWTKVQPATVPPGRTHHAIAYHPTRERVMLFGGQDDSGTLLEDFWEWDGANWTDITPSQVPPGRTSHSLAFDHTSGKLVLFGGQINRFVNDLWEWDGTQWTQRTPTGTSPSIRRNQATAYDHATSSTLSFGGFASGAIYTADTFTWSSADSAWTQRSPSLSPPPRSHASAAYDSQRQRVVIHGGMHQAETTYALTYYADTWEWDGTTWTEVATVNKPLATHLMQAMAYDSARGEMLVVDSESATWVYANEGAGNPSPPDAGSENPDTDPSIASADQGCGCQGSASGMGILVALLAFAALTRRRMSQQP